MSSAEGSLSGKIAFVTGASSGVGLETTRSLLRAGATVHAVARRYEAMVEGAGREAVESGSMVPHALDVADREAVERVVEEVGRESGIDILICAAGMNVPERRLESVAPEDWERILGVNLSGAFYFVRAALPHLRESRGSVVLVGSVSGLWPDVSGAAYQASKLGMLGITRAAGVEEHGRGVRFSTIMPGIIDTPILQTRPEPPSREIRELSLKPEDVAAAALFLVTLPPRAHIPELTIVPTAIQALGKTNVASPPVPENS